MKNKENTPQRRCIGCMTSKNQRDLIRMTSAEGHISIDENGRASGRGFYICLDIDCLSKAIKKKAFNRAVRGMVLDEDINQIREYIEKRTV